MNTERDLSKRLLKLFPVKMLKEHYKTEHVSDELFDEVLNNNIKAVIDAFAYVNLEHTKQHIYVFDLATAVNGQNLNLPAFPIPILNQSTTINETSIVFSPVVDFRVILANPFEEVILKFHQPFKIVLKNRHLVFYTTILEKNMNSHFADNRRVLNVEKVNDESFIIQQVCNHFAHLNPTACDLNTGIKHLWNADFVDSKYAKWKKDRSTTTETMDENYTLKSQYPDVYQNLITSPLKKMIFKYILQDELLPDHFTIDPAVGQISIPLFPKTSNQNQNVVTQILSNN